MEPSSPKTARTITFILNSLFLLGSVTLLVLVVFAAVGPPRADIGPKRVNEYPEFLATIGLLALFGLSLFSLHFLGVIATCISNSFLLSVFVIGQLALIGAQFVAIAFTLTVRTRLHARLEETWRDMRVCSADRRCEPVDRFKHSEFILLCALFGGFLLQVALLVASSIYCEKISYAERLTAQIQREKEEDED